MAYYIPDYFNIIDGEPEEIEDPSDVVLHMIESRGKDKCASRTIISENEICYENDEVNLYLDVLFASDTSK